MQYWCYYEYNTDKMIFLLFCVLRNLNGRGLVSVFVQDEQTYVRFERIQERKKWCTTGQDTNLLGSCIHSVYLNWGVRLVVSLFVQDEHTHGLLQCDQKRKYLSACWQAVCVFVQDEQDRRMARLRPKMVILVSQWAVCVFVQDEQTHTSLACI